MATKAQIRAARKGRKDTRVTSYRPYRENSNGRDTRPQRLNERNYGESVKRIPLHTYDNYEKVTAPTVTPSKSHHDEYVGRIKDGKPFAATDHVATDEYADLPYRYEGK